MKTAYNIQGNLTTLLSQIVAGTVSQEVAQLESTFLYFFVDQSGTAWAFADGGVDVTVSTPFPGNPVYNFVGNGLQWMRPVVQTNSGAQDSKATLVCFPSIDDPVFSNYYVTTFFDGCQDGLFDGAIITVFRYMQSDPNAVQGLIKEFVGWVGQIKADRSKIEIEVNGIFHQANIRLPKRPYSPACSHALFDAGCGLNPNAFYATFTIGSVDVTYPQQVLHFSVYTGALPPGTFGLGAVTFLTGLNAGLVRTIKGDNGVTFTLATMIPNIPVIGDTFNATFGCDKMLSTCINKFGNFTNFNGFPFIPPENIFG